MRFSIAAIAISSQLLVACGQQSASDTVDSLAADPQRLRALREQCKLEREKVGDALCRLVSEATRKRFMGESGSPQTTR
jgi:hypothetical protein